MFNIKYLYRSNTRKNTIHTLDYELEVDVGDGYTRTERVYGAHKVPNWTFSSQSHTIKIPDYPKKLITARAEPLELCPIPMLENEKGKVRFSPTPATFWKNSIEIDRCVWGD